MGKSLYHAIGNYPEEHIFDSTKTQIPLWVA
jgi:hypothetical protein